MRLSKGDELVSVDINQKDNIIAVSKEGYVLRFRTDDLPEYGTTAGGVQGMLLTNDSLAEAFYAFDDDGFVMLTIRGHIITDSVNELAVYNRNRRGIRVVENLKSNPHYIVSAARISKHQERWCRITLVTTKQTYHLKVNEYKYNYNKYGKKMFDERKN